MIYLILSDQESADFWSAPDIDSACQKLNNSPVINNKVLHERITVFELVHAMGFDDDIDARAEGFHWLADLYRENPDTMLYRSEFVKNGAYGTEPLDKKDVLVKALSYSKNKPKVFFSDDDLLTSYNNGELNSWLSQDQIQNLMLQVQEPAKH